MARLGIIGFNVMANQNFKCLSFIDGNYNRYCSISV